MYSLSLLLIIFSIIKIVLAQNNAIPAPTDIPDIPQPDSIKGGTNYEYTKLLAYSLLFYEAQRSGNLPPNNRVSWRHDSALTDGNDVNVNLEGGYYDAGDHLKFTFPLSWTLTSTSWGAYKWYEGYKTAQQTTQIRDMIKWGTDWLIKAYVPDQQVLYVMIGNEKIDHDYWGPDTNIPLPRPSLSINSTAHGTEAAAEAAAAMAAASLFFRDKVQDTDYADQLVGLAKQLYEFAKLEPFTLYQDSVKDIKGLYASNDFKDELVWSSLWLYKATRDQTYFDMATKYFTDFKLSGKKGVINWDGKLGAAYILFVECAMDLQKDVDVWKNEAEKYLDSVVSQSECQLTKGGLYYCDGDSDSASLNPALNAAFVSLLYSEINPTSSKRDNYIKFAKSQIDYLLGNNPMKIPYVIGVHPNSPQNPHHSGAHGGTSIKTPPTTAHVLYGGIVGGPDKDDVYNDDREKYEETEVALDYNAPFQNIMAYQVINSREDPFYVTLPPGKSGKPNVALIVSLVIIGALVVGGICGFVYWRKRRAA